MKVIRSAQQVGRVGVAAMLVAMGGIGCFSPLLMGIGGGSSLYQYETQKKPSSGSADSTSATKAKSKQNVTAKANDSNLE